jgi:aminodeoxychorismate lyase
MIVYLNGRFVPEEQACVSIHDRGFLYGDGLFEAVRLYNGEPFLWTEHMDRFAEGCRVLRIDPPLTARETRSVLAELLRRNDVQNALVRITLSRGPGSRGYSPRGADHPTFCIAAFPVPEKLPSSYKVVSSSIRLLNKDPLAAFKHNNKLRQIVARAEADDAGADEALLLNERGDVVEGTTTNLFWIESRTVCTPPLDAILSGTTRNYLLKLCAALEIRMREKNVSLQKLVQSDGVFLTSCGIEVMEVTHLNGIRLKRSPLVGKLKRNYHRSDVNE